MSETDDRLRFEGAYDAHLGAVLAYARRRTDPASAEDAVAEVFVTAWRRVADMPAEALPWLLAIARNTLANQARGDRRRLSLEHRLAAERPLVGEAPALEELDPRLAAALGRLSSEDREALCLLAWERLTRAEAARALGCSAATLRLRLHRARRRLARELGTGADAPAPCPPGMPDTPEPRGSA